MPKFTQGEWKADKFGDSIYFCDKDGNKVHFIKIQGENPVKIQANARLIASAPEMYELLENIVFYISECQKLYSPFSHELITYADIAKQLLAQIDGEENND